MKNDSLVRIWLKRAKSNLQIAKAGKVFEDIELIEEQNIKVPDEIMDSISLTAYAVSTRYPGDFEPVDEPEYQETLETAEKVYNWVKNIIQVGK